MITESPEEFVSYEDRNYHQQTSLSENLFQLYDTLKYSFPLYLKSFLPIITWLPRYNRRWFVRDLIAGVTVGVMIIPESLAYAKLAHVPLQYGLYSSFIGTMIYTFLGTTREIAVGPAAVLSLLIGETIVNVQAKHPDLNFKPQDITACLSFYASFIALFLGITRLASVLDLIPEPVVVGFTTGAALTIILSQLPSMLGIPNVSRDSSTVEQIYQLFYNIPSLTWMDIVFGLTSMLFICGLKFGTVPFLKKYPWLFYFKVGANGIAVVLFTIIAYVISINVDRKDFNLRVVGEVPSGIKDVGIPNLDPFLLKSVSTELIPIVLVMVLEHVSISRLFARKGKYQISASQELFAIGVCNLSASFLSAFPTTGSFTRSAVNFTSSIVTPLSGMVVGSIVLFAIYFLTSLFYYIPSPTLSAIIVVAAASLIVDYKSVKELFGIQFFEGIILLVAGVLTFFVSAEVGILAAVGLSFVLMIYRIARPQIYLLNQVLGRSDAYIDHKHPRFRTVAPIPGVLIFRPQESLTFPNIDYIKKSIIDTTIELTDPGKRDETANSYLWTDDIVTRSKSIREYRNRFTKKSNEIAQDKIPKLCGIILDFSAVNTVDASGIEGLIEIKQVLADYAGFLNIPNINKPQVNITKTKSECSCSDDIDNLGNDFDQRFSNDDIMDSKITVFEMHFVSVHSSVVNLLDRAELTKQVSTHFDFDTFRATSNKLIYNQEQSDNIDTSLSNKTTDQSLSLNLFKSPVILPKRSPRHFPDISNHNKINLRESFSTTIDPIAFKPSKFVHLTVADAVRRLRKRMNELEYYMSSSIQLNEEEQGQTDSLSIV